MASTQSDPLLVIELTPITGGEPVVTLSQGNAACCLDGARPGVHLDTLIRTRPERMPGDPHTEVRGEMMQRWRPGGAEGFRLEARFGAVWRPVDLVASGRMSIE